MSTNKNTASKSDVTVQAAPKAAASVELVLGQGSLLFNKAVSDLNKTLNIGLEQLAGLDQRVEILGLTISEKENKILQLDIDLQEKERANKVQLDLAVKANEESVVKAWLSRNGLEAIAPSVVKSLQDELNQIKAEFNDKVAGESKKAHAIAQAEFANKEKILNAEFTAKEAQNIAAISQSQTQINSLQTQITFLGKQLDDERNAGIERAKASAIGSVNVGSPTR